MRAIGAPGAVAVGVLLTLTGCPSGGAGPTGPNILIIVTDDQRLGTMSVMRETLQWFRSGGVDYPSAVATTPVCCPSRASIMTGRYTHNHGVENNHEPRALDQRSTVQRYLNDAGYLTAIAGKLLNNWHLATAPPYFDRWSIQNAGYEAARFNIDGSVGSVPGYSVDVVAEQALGYLRSFEEQDSTPWFLYVAPFAPHGPFRPAERHRDAPVPQWTRNPASEETNRADKPRWVRSQDADVSRARASRREQLRTLLAVDELVDAIMQRIADDGEGRETLAFFLSDNGFFWGEHGVGDKRLPYLEAVRVPFYARWPGRLPAGLRDERLVANIDVMPTILEAAGISADPRFPVDGRSLLGDAQREHILVEYSFDEATAIPPWASYLDARRQYSEYYGPDGEAIYREYYDLEADPRQLSNLLGDADPANDPSPAEVLGLSVTLARDRRCVGTRGSDACP